MIIQSGDLGVELDTGTNAPDAVLQRLEDSKCRDYPFDGEFSYLMDLSQMPPGKYRLVENPIPVASTTRCPMNGSRCRKLVRMS